jgi:hypothetical protein
MPWTRTLNMNGGLNLSPPDYVFVPDSAGKPPQIQKQSREGLLRVNEFKIVLKVE